MIRLAHLSDLHFGTEDPAILAALGQALASIDPNLLLISGDLTQRARRAQFRAAERFLGGLERPLIVVPGNHDIPLYNPVARALWPFRRYRERFGSSDLDVYERDGLRVIGVNTVRRERHASGRITAAQQRRVLRFLDAAPENAVNLVVLHHPLVVEHPHRDTERVEHGRRTLRRWSDAGVDLILSGHVHRPFALSVSAGSPGRRVWLLNAGTAISNRRRHGYVNSFNQLSVDVAKREIRLERWDHDPLDRRFEKTASRRMELAAARVTT